MKTFHFATAALLTAALGFPAAGQVQVQQGNALDANPQVGSGGANRVENQVDYQARNLLVTGNAAAGRSFRDSVGYTASGALRTNLGSDSLFSYQRDSIYSAPQSYGLGQNIRAQAYGDRVIITRSTTATPGQFASPGLGLTTRTTYDARSGTVSFRQNSGALVQVEGIRDLQDLTPASNVLATIRNRDGGFSRIEASPLNGLQVNPLEAQPMMIDPRTRRLVRPGELNQESTQRPLADPRDEEADPNDPRINNRYRDPSDRDGEEGQDDGENRTSLRVGDRVAPTLMLGNQLQQQMAAQAVNGEVRNFDDQVDQLQQQMFGPLAIRPERPDADAEASVDPYDRIIGQILERSRNPEEQKPQAEAGDEAEGDNTLPNWRDVFDEPDKAVQDAIKQAREDALRRSLGLVDENGQVNRDIPLPSPEKDGKLAELIAALDYNIPRVQTLAGDRENRLNTLLTRGEQELAAGRFLTSENIYRQILRESGDNPLARAGLIHSQLGAGMIRSAAFNIRSLFSEHPELIALQYDASLLPSTERLTWLQGELQKMINDENHSAEPGLVLAYLGYQLNAEPLVTYGLGVAEARTPRDPLMPMLRSIWIDGERGGENADEQQEAQPQEEPEAQPQPQPQPDDAPVGEAVAPNLDK